MKVLDSIKTEFLVSIDIETVRVGESFDSLSEGFKSAWEYKNKQDGVVPEYGELCELWERNASLYAEFSKVCAVSLSFMHGDRLYCREFYGNNEEALLDAVGITLNNINAKDRNYRLVGHASKYFDYPFLAKRFIINGLPIPDILDVTSLKPWEQKNLCTNELWRVGGTGAGSSLQALCNVLNIPVSKVDLVGDEVGKAFYNGEYERIGRYCSYDTVATFNVVRRFKGESIFNFEDVEYVLGYSDESPATEEAVSKSVLEKLHNSKALTEPIKQDIQKIINKKRVTKKDKIILTDMLYSVMQKFDFDSKDSEETLALKKEEVDNFIESL